MQFNSLILLFPAVSLASWPRQASSADECASTTKTLPPITQISVYPTSTKVALGCHVSVTGGGSPIHTAGVPSPDIDGQDGHTHSTSASCDGTQCQHPAPDKCPDGYTVTTIVCHTCGEKPVTSTVTLPIESAARDQGSGIHKGNSNIAGTAVSPTEFPSSLDRPPQGINTYTSIHRHPESSKSLKLPVPPTSTSLQTTVIGTTESLPTGAEVGPGSESAFPTMPIPVSPTTSDIVAEGRAAGNQAIGSTLVKVAAFGIILPFALFA
ncbi:hypothetical protein FCOIX_7224 [Fusarium coicis]|nr:hypothetical protein FCOIX_7224 [Fusarium coicis]